MAVRLVAFAAHAAAGSRGFVPAAEERPRLAADPPAPGGSELGEGSPALSFVVDPNGGVSRGDASKGASLCFF